jgi:hypothetical protein
MRIHTQAEKRKEKKQLPQAVIETAEKASTLLLVGLVNPL